MIEVEIEGLTICGRGAASNRWRATRLAALPSLISFVLPRGRAAKRRRTRSPPRTLRVSDLRHAGRRWCRYRVRPTFRIATLLPEAQDVHFDLAAGPNSTHRRNGVALVVRIPKDERRGCYTEP